MIGPQIYNRLGKEVISKMITNYATSFPIILPDGSERFFTCSYNDSHGPVPYWKEEEIGNKYFYIHEVYILNNGEVKILPINKKLEKLGKVRDSIIGENNPKLEIAMSKEYLELYEKLREIYYTDNSEEILNEKKRMKYLFDNLVTNAEEIVIYQFFGMDSMFNYLDK